jgi:glycosyltransferase involved in cell wall biosynthesis
MRLPGIGGRRFGLTTRPDRLARAVADADVVHAHDLRFMFGATAVAARARRRPLILHTHGLVFHTEFAGGIKRLALRAYYAPLIRFARARVVASSATDAARLTAVLPDLAARTVTFENALRLDRLLALERSPEPGRFLTVGRLAAHKGIDRLLRSLQRLGRPWTLELLGPADREERDRLADLAVALGIGDRVRFLGQTDDAGLRAALARAELGLFPSRSEGFGLALLESIAAGIPVVASDIPAHRDLLGPGLSGLLADFDHPEEVAARLESLLDAPSREREALSQRLRERSRDFAMHRLVAQIDGLYEAMLR